MPDLPAIAAKLLELADYLEAESEHVTPTKAVELLRRALVARTAAGELLRPTPRLTVKQSGDIVDAVEHPHSNATRRAISLRFSDPKDKNMAVARKAGFPSLRALAAAIKAETGNCSASYLSQVTAGKRPLSPDAAKAFKKLTGKDWQ